MRVCYLIILLICSSFLTTLANERPYPVVDTGQTKYYDDKSETGAPAEGSEYYGQDASYTINPPEYRDNKDGTVSDLVTGLMWQRDPGKNLTLKQAEAAAAKCRLGGYSDWRVPTIKELYSLILFSGTDPDPRSRDQTRIKPFIDTRYFEFRYGRESENERLIDSQYGSCTKYVSTTMRNDATLFGVNFADGRIKGYPLLHPRRRNENTFYFILVRGNKEYGKNRFQDNSNGTITDIATGLTWMKIDSATLKAGKNKDGTLNWKEALAWSENLTYAGKSDWRLPSAKELQSILDYTRSPDTVGSAAIDPIFTATEITNESGKKDYGYYWTSTTHASQRGGSAAAYCSFGRALGWMGRPGGPDSLKRLMDVHGSGSQRSDPKSGDPDRYPYGRGPQGDVLRIYNLVRCVRGGTI